MPTNRTSVTTVSNLAARFRPPNDSGTIDESNEQPPSEEKMLGPQQPQQTQPSKEIITSCPRCGAPIPPNQEDVVFTCRYCGFAVAFAGKDEIKIHSMLENHLHVQQAVETAQKYMDKGLFRSDVAENATITNVKLRYLPFWTFPVTANTNCSGITGTGLQGEMQQLQNVLRDKQATKASRFGSLLKAGASAFFESQQQNRQPKNVSLSFSSNYTWPILSRKSTIREISYYDVPIARKIPFDFGRIPSDAEFLKTEYTQEEAKLKVKTEVEGKERGIASGKVDTLQSCNINTTIGEGELVAAPVWFVNYKVKGDNYTVLIDGAEGKVLGGGKPLFHF